MTKKLTGDVRFNNDTRGYLYVYRGEELVATLDHGGISTIFGYALSPDQQYIVTVGFVCEGNDLGFRLWDLSGKNLGDWCDDGNDVLSAEWKPDSKALECLMLHGEKIEVSIDEVTVKE